METSIEKIRADKKALENNITNLVREFITKHDLTTSVDVFIEEVVFNSEIRNTIVKTKVNVRL